MLKEMKFEHFLMEIREDGIAIFAAHRPKVKNALSMAAWAELALFLETAQRDDDVRVIIFTGSEGSFVAGMDISEIGRTDPYDASFLGASQKVGALLERGAKPVIAAVNGPAFGGGFEIALACDLRIVSETAMFALPELGIGAIPALGGTQRLCKFIGVGRAKEVLLADKRIKGQEAVDLGLATKCVPDDQLMEEAVKLAKRVLAKSPTSIALAKRLVDSAFSLNDSVGALLENLGAGALQLLPEMAEGSTSFMQKRAPDFWGVRAAAAEKYKK